MKISTHCNNKDAVLISTFMTRAWIKTFGWSLWYCCMFYILTIIFEHYCFYSSLHISTHLLMHNILFCEITFSVQYQGGTLRHDISFLQPRPVSNVLLLISCILSATKATAFFRFMHVICITRLSMLLLHLFLYLIILAFWFLLLYAYHIMHSIFFFSMFYALKSIIKY